MDFNTESYGRGCGAAYNIVSATDTASQLAMFRQYMTTENLNDDAFLVGLIDGMSD